MPEKRPNRLGKGLDALLGRREESETEIRNVDVNKIRPNPQQPRRAFDEDALKELAASIQQHGVVQPVLLRGDEDLMANYELVAGERRWRAAQLAGLETIPAVVRQLDDETTLAVSLIENLQREDLNPIEEGQAYQQLMERFSLTQAEVADRVGKSRPHVANTVRLLNLDEGVLEMVAAGVLTQGHARALLALPAGQQVPTAEKAVEEGWTVRAMERYCQRLLNDDADPDGETEEEKVASPVDVELAALATRIGQRLGTSVAIRGSERKGAIVIDYFGTEDLERLLDLLGITSGGAA